MIERMQIAERCTDYDDIFGDEKCEFDCRELIEEMAGNKTLGSVVQNKDENQSSNKP